DKPSGSPYTPSLSIAPATDLRKFHNSVAFHHSSDEPSEVHRFLSLSIAQRPPKQPKFQNLSK
ncbi:hypothetical protein A2U01_0064057, partial [Trifolium medium]|nr:hypothetical protein [Trifolium medium]